MFTIRVISKETGRPLEGERVCVGFDGMFRGFTSDDYTDEDGEVDFSEDNGTGTIYVDGDAVFEGRIQGKKTIYI